MQSYILHAQGKTGDHLLDMDYCTRTIELIMPCMHIYNIDNVSATLYGYGPVLDKVTPQTSSIMKEFSHLNLDVEQLK